MNERAAVESGTGLAWRDAVRLAASLPGKRGRVPGDIRVDKGIPFRDIPQSG